MEPMVGLDAKFLYSETPSTHMHTLKVAVFDMTALGGGYSYEQVLELFGRRLDRLPRSDDGRCRSLWGSGTRCG